MQTFYQFIEKHKLDISSPEKRKSANFHYRSYYQKQYKKEYNKSHKRIEITLSISDHTLFNKEAQKHDTRLNLFVLNCAKAYLNQDFILPEPKTLNELVLNLRAVGNNINQVAYQLNANSINTHYFDERHIFNHLAKLENLIIDFIKKPKKTNQGLNQEHSL